MSSVRVTFDDGLGRIVLSRPPLNILDRATLAELRQAVDRLGDAPSLRAVLLTAEGRHFSAGAEVAEHLPPTFEAMIREFLETVAALREFPLPVIAAVRGRCLGGGLELVLAADLVVAAESAQFGQPEIHLGVIPPVACALLATRVGAAAAAALVFTGDPLDATAAWRAGLVWRVVPDADLESAALGLAAHITRHSAVALRLAKRAMREPADHDRRTGMEAAGRIYVDELMQTADAVEGLTAFLEKRPPRWSHR